MTDTLPLVSVGIAVWNGEAFLEKALRSLLNQDYRNIEIVILDNHSSDSTARICQDLSKEDSRVRYILDDQKRDVMSAQTKAAHLANGEFYMVACDDDWYAPNYISRLMGILGANPEIGLAYCALGFIDEDDRKASAPPRPFFSKNDDPIENFRSYLSKRDPVPIVFGIIRKNIHLDALQYFIKPDRRGWDHDNLYLMRLLSQTRVEGIAEVLFYYRQQDRDALYKKRNQSHDLGNPFANYLSRILHQWSVSRVVNQIIDDASFSARQKVGLQMSNYRSFFRYIHIKYLREGIRHGPAWKKIQSIFVTPL